MESLEERVAAIAERYRELEAELSDPESYADQPRVQRLSQERARISEVVEASRRWRAAVSAADAAAGALQGEHDPEMVALFQDEERTQRHTAEAAEGVLRRLLVPRDPNDDRDVIVEIRAGTGGDEAGLFAADLLRMYGRYAERRRWSVELISESPSGARGFKSRSTVTAPTPGSSSSPACTGSSGCPKPRPRAGSTPPQRAWSCFPRPTMLRSPLTRTTSRSTST
jgi:peptide chain release factor 1